MKKKKRGLDLAEVLLYTIPEDELLDVPEEELAEMADRIVEDFDVDLKAEPIYTEQELDKKYKQFLEYVHQKSIEA